MVESMVVAAALSTGWLLPEANTASFTLQARAFYVWGFPGGSEGKESACNFRRSWVRSLGWEDYLEKGMKTHFSVCLGNSMVQQGIRHDRLTNTFTLFSVSPIFSHSVMSDCVRL